MKYKRYIALFGYVVDLEEMKIVYHFDDDKDNKFERTREEDIDSACLEYLFQCADVPYDSDDFTLCAIHAQLTL